MSGGWKDYFIPGTTVLKNLLGTTDAEELRLLEEKLVFLRISELQHEPLEGSFDYQHFKAIHRHLFQDVYEWAGQESTAPTDQFMVKAGHAYYPAGPELTKAANKIFAGLARDNLLCDMTLEEFVPKLAEVWGELNVVHSFREGNTRTQTVFFAFLVDNAGFALDVERLAVDSELRERFIAARFHSQDTDDNAQLARVLREIVGNR